MRAIAINDFESPPSLQDLPDPTPGDGQLLVEVKASSVNPVDAGIAGGMLKAMFDYEFPVFLGRDFAGTVQGVGSGVDILAVGDDVFGFVLHADPSVHDGSWAERILVPADGLVGKKPSEVDFLDAGAAPLAALTAIAAADALEIGADDTVLIVGASGGVGSFAVQLAKRAGATVIAPGLPEDEDYLRSLGADEVIARGADLTSSVKEIEPAGASVLIDTVSMAADGVEANAEALADGARIASPTGAAGEGPRRHNVMGSGNPAAVAKLADLLADGSLRVPIQRTFPLERAVEALDTLTAEHTQGKLAIRVS